MQAEWTPEVERLIRSGAWVCWSVSGGKDSSAAMAATIPMLDAVGHPRERRLALHADLGRSEWRSTHAHAQSVCNQLGVPLQVVRHKTHDMVSRWERRGELGRIRYRNLDTIRMFGPWSSSSMLFCRSELKIQILEDYKKNLGAPVVSVVGVRREESTNRRRTKISTRDGELAKRLKHEALVWNPIAAWTTDEVFSYHADHAIPLHEAYHLGSTRLSCAFCVLGSLNDLSVSASAEQNQDLFRTQVDMEARYWFSFQPSRWLGDIAPHLLDQRLVDALAHAKQQALARQEIEADIPPEMRFKDGEIPIIPDMTMAARMASVRRGVAELHSIDALHLDAASVVSRMREIVAGAMERKARANARALKRVSPAKVETGTYMFA